MKTLNRKDLIKKIEHFARLAAVAVSIGCPLVARKWAKKAQELEDTLPPPEQKASFTSKKSEKSEKKVLYCDKEIAVSVPYDPTGTFQQLAKTIAGWRWSPTDQTWRYPMSAIDQVKERYPDTEYYYSENLLQVADKEADEPEAQREQESVIVAAADLNGALSNGWFLREYQKKGAEWLMSRVSGILADHMGLGKTLTTLMAARGVQRVTECKVIVIAPVSLLKNWQKEAILADVKIETYSWGKLPEIPTEEFVLIADEAHYAQNEKSQRTQKFLSLSSSNMCLNAWMLTGTPLKNGRPINLFPLLLAGKHPLANNKFQYQKRYCDAKHKNIGRKTVWDNSGAINLPELAEKTASYILRRTKQECLKELPSKTRLMRQVELSSSAEKEYRAEVKALIEDYKNRVKEGKASPDAEAIVTVGYLRRITSKYKVESAIELAREILEEGGGQVVLFTEFLETAHALYEALGGEILTGATPSPERQNIVVRFQCGQSRIFIGTIKAGGVGITLTAAGNVVLVDRPWTPGDCEQAEDRCHRMGQQNPVFATWLQLGAIDEKIDGLLQDKQANIDVVMSGSNARDLLKLFKVR